jgi:hypothetical protein
VVRNKKTWPSPETFARDILPTYFKHNNIRSFIRQLNTYGFRKRTNISSSDEHLEFFHEKFKRDEPGLLTQIKRCHQPKPSAASAARGDENTIGEAKTPQDLDTIRGRVSELKSRLSTLQTEIRDYNQQMEQKVNILMHILQTSTAPATASSTQLQQQLSLAQPAPSTSAMAPSQPMSHPGMLTNSSNGGGTAGLSTGLLSQLSNNSSGAGAACASANAISSANLLQQARKDTLLGSFGQQVCSPSHA